MPMAHSFNETVALDLKTDQDQHILHIIDMWSRYSLSFFIKRKFPAEVIDKFYGALGEILWHS